MSWTPLTINDIEDYLAAPQLSALRTRGLGTEQSDPLVAVIADVTARVRAEIAAFSRNQLAADATLLPPELKSTAAALAIENAQGRVPVLKLTPDQVRAAERARTLLQRVARGEVAISAPVEAASPRASSATLRYRPDRLVGDSLKGLR